MACILGIGIATLDIIITVDGYPAEDSKVRALGQRVCRGGNVTNTLTVLSQLGHRCAWGGTLADEPDGRRILAELARYHIDTGPTRTLPTGKVPTSYIVLNQRTGSRTIVNYRDLPEYGYDDFAAIDLTPYDWIHFEGREVEDTERMLRRVQEIRPELPCSVEIEVPRTGIERLLPYPGVVLFSRSYARAHGHTRAAGLLDEMRLLAPQADLICAWGERGAYSLSRAGEFCHSPAYPPVKVIDTVGAGDTFNAGIIDAMLRGLDLRAALDAACRLAGNKCGVIGLHLQDGE